MFDDPDNDPRSLLTTHLEALDRRLFCRDASITQRLSMLVFSEIDAAFTHLTDLYGLGPGDILRDSDGAAPNESAEFGLASPRTLGGASAMAVMVDNVDTQYERLVENGAEVVYPPIGQSYGFREFSARDSEGGLWSFMKALDSVQEK